MAPTTSATPPPPPPPAAGVKKSSPWKWILIGCAGIFVLGCVVVGACSFFFVNRAKNFVEEASANPAKAAAEMAVRLNPDLELVSTDDAAETITIRDKKTGKVSTVDWSAIEDGKLTFESDGETYTVDGSEAADGRIAVQNENGEETMTFGAGAGDLPDWFPAYHNAEATNVLVNANQNGQQSTIWTFTTVDGVTDVLSFYETQLEGSGWEVTTNSSDLGGTSNGSLEGKQDGGAKTLNLVITKSGSEAAQAMVTYTATGG
jgi:hypothetical protein